jgi:hypothetical protein
MSNISPQKNARTPEQNISLRNLCKNFWLEETVVDAIVSANLVRFRNLHLKTTDQRWWFLPGTITLTT